MWIETQNGDLINMNNAQYIKVMWHVSTGGSVWVKHGEESPECIYKGPTDKVERLLAQIKRDLMNDDETITSVRVMFYGDDENEEAVLE